MTQPLLPELGVALLVRLQLGLDRSRRAGIFAAVKDVPGVDVVVDLATVSHETLEVLLLPDEFKVRQVRHGRARRGRARQGSAG